MGGKNPSRWSKHGGYIDRFPESFMQVSLHCRWMMRIDFVLLRGLIQFRLARRRIHRIPKLLRGFEEWNALCPNIDFGACFWISSGSGVSLTCPEASEAANLDLVTGLKCSNHRFKEGIDDDHAVTPCEITKGGNFIDKICFGHERNPFKTRE